MVGIIVVFPNKDNAANIRNLLVRNGMDVTGVCTTGAQALNYADAADDGVVVCGYKMKDMMYTELREYLSDRFEVLLVASPDKWTDEESGGVVRLPVPLKVYDLMDTMEMLLQSVERKRKKRRQKLKNRNPQQQALVNQAKELLMARNHMTEEEAHRYLQKNSMDNGTNMAETAQMVLRVMGDPFI